LGYSISSWEPNGDSAKHIDCHFDTTENRAKFNPHTNDQSRANPAVYFTTHFKGLCWRDGSACAETCSNSHGQSCTQAVKPLPGSPYVCGPSEKCHSSSYKYSKKNGKKCKKRQWLASRVDKDTCMTKAVENSACAEPLAVMYGVGNKGNEVCYCARTEPCVEMSSGWLDIYYLETN